MTRIVSMFCSKNVMSAKLISRQFEGKGEFTFYDTADAITPWVKSRLDISGSKIAADSDEDIRDILTPSLEALKFYIQGKENYYLGNYQVSNEILENAVEMDKQFALAYRQISENYHYLGKIDEAKQYARSALSMKDNVSLRDRYLLEGWASTILEESYKNAKKIYLEMLQNYPDDEDANIYLGALYRNMEEWDLAQARFENVLNTNPLMAIDNIFLFYRAKGQYGKALEFIKANKDNFPAAAYFHLDQGIIYFYQKNDDLSLVEFENALSLDSDFLEAKEMMGHFHFIRDELDQAEKYYSSLIDSESPIAKFFGRLWLFSLRIAQGRYQECKNAILTAIKKADRDQLKSDKLAFMNLLAYVNLRMNHLKEALEASKQAELIATELKFHQDKIIAFRLRGLCLLRMNKIEEAEKTATLMKSYLESIKIPKYMRYYHFLEGMIAFYKNRDSMAIENFTKAISLLSFQHEALDDHAVYIYSLAAAYNKINDLEKAQKQYEKIIELRSGRLQWGDIYAKSYYWLGKIYQKRGENQKAIENYDKFLELWKNADPEIPEIEDTKKNRKLIIKDLN